MFTQAPSFFRSDITITSSTDPYWSSVVLLCPFDSSFNDVKFGLSPSYTYAVSLVNARYGKGAKNSDLNSAVRFAASENYNFGTAPFTIDGWVTIPTTPANFYLFDISTARLAVRYTGGHWNIYNGGTINYNSAPYTLELGAPLYYELNRDGTTLTLFINGVAVITQTISASQQCGVNAILTIGNYGLSGLSLINSVTDDFRITKGVRRNATNYGMPTSAAPTR